MRTRKRWVVLATLLSTTLSVLTAFAADVTGKWSGDLKTGDGNNITLSFTFRQDGSKLTGTSSGPDGDSTPIQNGKVDGEKLAFIVSFNGTTITHKGTIKADEIDLDTTTDNPDMPGGAITLKRSK